MKNRINTAKSRLFASHELYSVVKDQDYQVLVIDAEIDTFGVTIITKADLISETSSSDKDIIQLTGYPPQIGKRLWHSDRRGPED